MKLTKLLLCLTTAIWSVSACSAERVIVVGAGIAGLAAAQDLHENGFDVVVLEARNRIGGRIHTDRSTGIPLDMGASWIHGIKNNPITDLANEIGAPLSRETKYDNVKEFDFDGTPNPISTRQEEKLAEFIERESRRAYNRENKVTIGSIIDDAWDAGELDFLDNRRQLNYLVNVILEHEYSGDSSRISAQQAWEGEDDRGGDKVFPNGYDQLTSHLAKNLDIRLNTVVTQIKHDDKGVMITTSDGTFAGDRAVITLPVGVLKSGDVRFSPGLPKSKREAIEHLEMGTLNKVWMIFPYTFWDLDKNLLGYVSEEKGRFSEWYYFKGIGAGKVLIGFNAGAYGEAIEANTDQEIVGEAMDTLRVMYGNKIPDPTDSVISRWHADPFSRGSYAFMGEMALPEHRNKLRRPINDRLFFAGEATSSDHPATTHGAYLEGAAAAKVIKRLLY